MVLEKYPNLRYCRIKRNTKIPFEKDWVKKGYTFEEIKKFIPKEQYGIICGEGGLIIIDSDTPELQKAVEENLPETYRVKTGSGGFHNYFFCSEQKKKIVLTKNKKHYGEVQSTGSQCVGAGAIHPNGKEYEKVNEHFIATITQKQLESGLKDFFPEQNSLKTEENQDFKPLIDEMLGVWNTGDRQNRTLSLSGYLRKEKRLGKNKVKSIVKEICEKTKDNELSMRLRAVDETFNKDENEIKGYTGVKDVVDKNPVKVQNHTLMTYKDFKTLKKEKNYLIENFLYPETITMVYSPPANFKSLIFEYLAFCVANGKSFMGLKTKKKPVLYLDGENSKQILKERYQQLHKGLNLKRNTFPLFVLNNGMFLDNKKNIDEGFIMYLERILEEQGIKILIIDTLHRFAFYDENRADDINLLYTKVFKPLIDKYGISILFLHHSTKNGGYRGSGDFLGMVDVSYSVVRESKSNKFRILNEKCRSGEIADIHGEIDFQEEYIKVMRLNKEREEEKKLSKLKEVTNKIRAMFDKHLEIKRKDILDTFELENYQCDTRTIDRSLRYLTENGYLDKEKRGIYRRILT